MAQGLGVGEGGGRSARACALTQTMDGLSAKGIKFRPKYMQFDTVMPINQREHFLTIF